LTERVFIRQRSIKDTMKKWSNRLRETPFLTLASQAAVVIWSLKRGFHHGPFHVRPNTWRHSFSFFQKILDIGERDIHVRKGKRGRGAAGKIAVFGLLKRNGRVYTVIIPDARTETLLPIIKGQMEPDSIVYTDTFSAYNALDINGFHHHRINHSQKFAEQHNHINGIENFWNQAKRHLRRFNGIKPEHLYCFLKECEWRFNGGNHKELLTQLTYWVKQAKH